MKKLLSLLLFAGLSVNGLAKEYFVAVDGNNRSDGSKQAPFRTIHRAIGAAVTPGDVITVLEGRYVPPATLNLSRPGQKGKPITLRAEPGKFVVIDGAKMPDGANVIGILAAFIRVQGVTVEKAKATGIVAWGPGSRVHDIEIIGNTTRDCFQGGIFAGSRDSKDPVRDILMEGNTISQTSLQNVNREMRGSWALGVGGGTTRGLTIRNNDVYENHGEGIGLYLSDRGTIVGNRVHDNFAVNIYLDNTTNTLVDKNICYSTGNETFFRFGKPTNGIQIANETYPGNKNISSGNTITHNLLIENGAAFYCGSYQEGGGLRDTIFAQNTCYGSHKEMLMIDPDSGHNNCRIENNIFYQSRPNAITYVPGDGNGIAFQNNLWFGGRPGPAAVSDTDLYVDPQFANPGGLDWDSYRLSVDSPAIGLGTSKNK